MFIHAHASQATCTCYSSLFFDVSLPHILSSMWSGHNKSQSIRPRGFNSVALRQQNRFRVAETSLIRGSFELDPYREEWLEIPEEEEWPGPVSGSLLVRWPWRTGIRLTRPCVNLIVNLEPPNSKANRHRRPRPRSQISKMWGKFHRIGLPDQPSSLHQTLPLPPLVA